MFFGYIILFAILLEITFVFLQLLVDHIQLLSVRLVDLLQRLVGISGWGRLPGAANLHRLLDRAKQRIERRR